MVSVAMAGRAGGVKCSSLNSTPRERGVGEGACGEVKAKGLRRGEVTRAQKRVGVAVGGVRGGSHTL